MSCPDQEDMLLAVAGLRRDAARTDTTDKVPLQRLTESLPFQSTAVDAGPAHFRLTHGDALAMVKTFKTPAPINAQLFTLLRFTFGMGEIKTFAYALVFKLCY